MLLWPVSWNDDGTVAQCLERLDQKTLSKGQNQRRNAEVSRALANGQFSEVLQASAMIANAIGDAGGVPGQFRRYGTFLKSSQEERVAAHLIGEVLMNGLWRIDD